MDKSLEKIRFNLHTNSKASIDYEKLDMSMRRSRKNSVNRLENIETGLMRYTSGYYRGKV
jgi:hypothetical protein